MTPTREMIGEELRRASEGGYVYLASPYSKMVATIGLDEAARTVALAAGSLMAEGVVVYSPITHGHAVSVAYDLDKLDADFWMKQCFPMLAPAAICAVVTFHGWRESSGVKAEIEYAREHGIPVVYLSPDHVIPAIKFNQPA